MTICAVDVHLVKTKGLSTCIIKGSMTCIYLKSCEEFAGSVMCLMKVEYEAVTDIFSELKKPMDAG